MITAIMVLAFLVCWAVDLVQTLKVIRPDNGFYELNPILGEYPKPSAVKLYFAAQGVLVVAALFMLPEIYGVYVIAAGTGGHFITVIWNWRQGV